jgi:DnaK suppressor protein
MTAQQKLTATQLRDLRFELLVERARLKRSIEAAVAVTLSNAYAGHEDDAGPQHDAVVATDVEARFDAVSAALDRLEAGTYGECNECQQPIPFGRLIVMPESTHCIGCRPRG